jgi:hypothetical protein
MGNISKCLAVLLTLIIATSCLGLLAVNPANAQISKPSVPEFTVKYVDRSYDIPPEYGVDQYTGETVVTKEGEHVEDRKVEITIKNQPFTPYTDPSTGRLINLFYNVRSKGSYGQDWTELFGGRRSQFLGQADPYFTDGYPSQDSASQVTVVTIGAPSKGQMDIQVEALKGNVLSELTGEGGLLVSIRQYTFYGEESGWSDTKSVTIGDAAADTIISDGTPTPSPTPTEAPTDTPTIEPSHAPLGVHDSLNQSSLIAVCIGITGVAILVAVVLALNKSKQTKKATSNQPPPPPPASIAAANIFGAY